MSTTENAANTTAPQAEAKQKISLSEIHALLDGGMNREQIQAHYGWSNAQLKSIFAHETLKNRRGKKDLGIELVEDYVAPPKKEKKAATTTATTNKEETTNNPVSETPPPASEANVSETPAPAPQPEPEVHIPTVDATDAGQPDPANNDW